MAKRLSTSKWTKYKRMKEAAALRPHLPETAWLKESSLWSMLDKYGEVIVKPTGSWGGEGVTRIQKHAGGAYTMHAGSKKQTYPGKAALWARIRKTAAGNYIVQQRIALAAVDGRPFDLRVMVQRHSKKDWTVTGKLAKVAGKGYIVTNIRRSGGTVMSVEAALRRSPLNRFSQQTLLEQMDKVGIQTAAQLQKYYPYARTMGIDIGLDDSGRIWLIEANFSPMRELFLKLKDKSMYKKIMSYK